MKTWCGEFGARLMLAAVWLVHWLPLGVQAAIGRALGRVLHRVAASRRRIARRNLELCLPELDASARDALVREHFGWMGRSLVEHGLLWYASAARLKRLIHVEGDIALAQRSARPVMWLAPHFVGLEQAGIATRLLLDRDAVSIYQNQSNAVMNRALLRGRSRFGHALLYSRHESARPVVRAIKRGCPFFNLPDMDFGLRDAAFVPFFGVPAATLLAPARMARALGMVVQPVVATILPGGRGYRVRFLPAWDDFPGDMSDLAATARINRWIEDEVRRNPAQYLWVHRRFKTRPEGESGLY
jgi:Kdo2-lipid IVA lauroyltransferase/acyltransferase